MFVTRAGHAMGNRRETMWGTCGVVLWGRGIRVFDRNSLAANRANCVLVCDIYLLLSSDVVRALHFLPSGLGSPVVYCWFTPVCAVVCFAYFFRLWILFCHGNSFITYTSIYMQSNFCNAFLSISPLPLTPFSALHFHLCPPLPPISLPSSQTPTC